MIAAKVPQMILALLVLGLGATGGTVRAGPATAPGAIELDARDARPLCLPLGGAGFPLAGGGGFSVYDATSRTRIDLPVGTLSRTGDGTVYVSETPDMRLRATFSARDGVVTVRGILENRKRDDRGFLLDYRLPLPGAEAVFSASLDEAVEAGGLDEQESNAFPLAAMCSRDAGVAIAIPPTEPRVFGLVGDRRGLALRFYIGTSPETRRFPDQASFEFLIYAVEPAWGFRSALSRYYAMFPDFYEQRLPREGFFMFQMADRMPPNPSDYGFNVVGQHLGPKVIAEVLRRDDAHDIATFPYMIVGQREIKFLPRIPGSYQELTNITERWTHADHARHELHKERNWNRGDRHLREEIASSGAMTSDGRWSTVVRETPWGGNSITFRVNPNPYLFADEGRLTVGSLALEVAREWHAENPQFDGTYVDSLGAGWPAVLNYRRDHFPYALHPLTVDSDGRVALQNVISHYEYIDALRRFMRAQGKMVLGNGVYAYRSRSTRLPAYLERQEFDPEFMEYMSVASAPEHYRPGTKLGRFFCAALLDVASSEAGIRATLERCRDVRTMMGRKPYAFLNYRWEDEAKVFEYVNKSLSYGIYPTNTKNFFTGEEYDDHPEGYSRDKALLDWALALLRRINGAGWEPLTYARVDDAEIVCERFGSGDEMYVVLYNDATDAKRVVVRLDLKALGLDPATADIREIARDVVLNGVDSGKFEMELAPKHSYVLQVSRKSGSVKDRLLPDQRSSFDRIAWANGLGGTAASPTR